jgi:hypothetical protein
MKKTLLTLTLAIIATLSFVSCSKTNGTPDDSYNFNGNIFGTPHAFVIKSTTSETISLVLSSFDLRDTVPSTDVQTYVQILFPKGPLEHATYVYNNNAYPADQVMPFSNARLYLSYPYRGMRGGYLEGISTGVVRVDKNGDEYSIDYTLMFGTGKLQGKYSGKLTSL